MSGRWWCEQIQDYGCTWVSWGTWRWRHGLLDRENCSLRAPKHGWQGGRASISANPPSGRRPHVYSTWWWGAAWTSSQGNGRRLPTEASTGAPSHPQRSLCSFCCPWSPLVSCAADSKGPKVNKSSPGCFYICRWYQSLTSTFVATTANPFFSMSLIWKQICILVFLSRSEPLKFRI